MKQKFHIGQVVRVKRNRPDERDLRIITRYDTDNEKYSVKFLNGKDGFQRPEDELEEIPPNPLEVFNNILKG